MGLTCSSASKELTFHPHCRGSHIFLNPCHHQAKRFCSFHDGLVFSSRKLRPNEKVWIKILEEELSWHGALRVGFTSVDPNTINTSSLPPFACPDLTAHPGFWAIGIPEELCEQGAELCFWIDRKGQALLQRGESSETKLLFSGIPTKTPVWALVDIYGRTKAVQLMNRPFNQPKHCCYHQQPSKGCSEKCSREKSLSTVSRFQCLHKSTTTDFRSEKRYPLFYEEDTPLCVICQDRRADTLLLPCLHNSFCEQCTVRVKNQNSLCPLCREPIEQTQKVEMLMKLLVDT